MTLFTNLNEIPIVNNYNANQTIEYNHYKISNVFYWIGLFLPPIANLALFFIFVYLKHNIILIIPYILLFIYYIIVLFLYHYVYESDEFLLYFGILNIILFIVFSICLSQFTSNIVENEQFEIIIYNLSNIFIGLIKGVFFFHVILILMCIVFLTYQYDNGISIMNNVISSLFIYIILLSISFYICMKTINNFKVTLNKQDAFKYVLYCIFIMLQYLLYFIIKNTHNTTNLSASFISTNNLNLHIKDQYEQYSKQLSFLYQYFLNLYINTNNMLNINQQNINNTLQFRSLNEINGILINANDSLWAPNNEANIYSNTIQWIDDFQINLTKYEKEAISKIANIQSSINFNNMTLEQKLACISLYLKDLNIYNQKVETYNQYANNIISTNQKNKKLNDITLNTSIDMNIIASKNIQNIFKNHVFNASFAISNVNNDLYNVPIIGINTNMSNSLSRSSLVNVKSTNIITNENINITYNVKSNDFISNSKLHQYEILLSPNSSIPIYLFIYGSQNNNKITNTACQLKSIPLNLNNLLYINNTFAGNMNRFIINLPINENSIVRNLVIDNTLLNLNMEYALLEYDFEQLQYNIYGFNREANNFVKYNDNDVFMKVFNVLTNVSNLRPIAKKLTVTADNNMPSFICINEFKRTNNINLFNDDINNNTLVTFYDLSKIIYVPYTNGYVFQSHDYYYNNNTNEAIKTITNQLKNLYILGINKANTFNVNKCAYIKRFITKEPLNTQMICRYDIQKNNANMIYCMPTSYGNNNFNDNNVFISYNISYEYKKDIQEMPSDVIEKHNIIVKDIANATFQGNVTKNIFNIYEYNLQTQLMYKFITINSDINTIYNTQLNDNMITTTEITNDFIKKYNENYVFYNIQPKINNNSIVFDSHENILFFLNKYIQMQNVNTHIGNITIFDNNNYNLYEFDSAGTIIIPAYNIVITYELTCINIAVYYTNNIQTNTPIWSTALEKNKILLN